VATVKVPHRVAVVQRPPVLLDRRATIDLVVSMIAEVAAEGAKLVSFPEAFLPGYPEWIWRLRPGADYQLTGEIHEKLIANAVDLAGDDLAPILAAARRAGVTVVLGVHERDSSFSRATLYNTVVIIGSHGEILNRHRKLMPTNPERMVWGMGDATGLRVVETESGRLGSLICWENYMPLARYSLYAEGVEIYIAPTWDMGLGWISSMIHIAREGRCWVIGNGSSLKGSDIPADFPERDRLFPDPEEWINDGDSVVVAPDGTITAGPLNKQHGILYAECDPARATAAHRTMDVAGHYSRPDVFRLEVMRGLPAPVRFTAAHQPGPAASAGLPASTAIRTSAGSAGRERNGE
jgi:nitrilase